jgi:hypothetical protein
VRVSTVPAEAALAEGYEALATGGWAAARDAFTELLDRSETPDALAGKGRALWWLYRHELAHRVPPRVQKLLLRQ